ncbi:ABC transporter ATP-binding protein [Prosthecomicrobium sp. N25]|uniref:ABC transporter ATP-binding protein n=1 Tax=Prosthecomicrobium sp. N25 TaxID=3129254 RepID=UPI0030785840
MAGDTLLEIRGLKTHFATAEGLVKAVDGVDLTVRRGRTLCVLGESGCGKSITARSVLQIVDRPGRIVAGQILLHGADGTAVDIAALPPAGREIRAIRGARIAMIFQEPMTSLSPVHTIGNQIVETILLHQPVERAEAEARAIAMLKRVGIPNAADRLSAYPFQLSGGMRQRAMIALALSCEPELLIADEPTTALDVTTQATILDLMRDLQAEFGMAMMFITHDLGVVAEIADDVAVMYLGEVVEQAPVDALFHAPRHPYTRALLGSVPRLGGRRADGLRGRLVSIRGMVPHPFARPDGCPFNTRCDVVIPGLCRQAHPGLTAVGPEHAARCHHVAREEGGVHVA